MPQVAHTPAFSLRYEDDAEGIVAAVFLDIRKRMAFVPALFKALASEPEALVPAWLQARSLYDDPRSVAAAARLRAVAGPALAYRPGAAVREAVGPFAEELPALLLIVTSLGLAIDGAVPLQPLPPLDLPEPGPLPETPVPEERGEHPLFEGIRAVYLTHHVPSMYRALAARGLLEEPWHAIGPFLAGAAGATLVTAVEAAATAEARMMPEHAFFTSEEARPLLDQFRRALPRNLVFALAASAR